MPVVDCLKVEIFSRAKFIKRGKYLEGNTIKVDIAFVFLNFILNEHK